MPLDETGERADSQDMTSYAEMKASLDQLAETARRANHVADDQDELVRAGLE